MNPFFQAMADWERAPEVLAAFDRFFAAPLGGSPQQVFARLYRRMVEKLLQWLGFPAAPGAELREWRALFLFGSEADPYYVTEGQVAEMLARCPPMAAEPRERLGSAVGQYFALLRGGFLKNFPSPLVSEPDCRRWSELFGPELAWQSLEILRAASLWPIGGSEGFRVWQRWESAAFAPETTPAALGAWQARCAENAADGGSHFSPHRLDFLAAAYGGAFPGLGVSGPCGEVPRCGDCALRRTCAWGQEPAKTATTAAAVLGRLGHQRAANLTTAQLMQGLFGLAEPEAAALGQKLEAIPLRTLAGQTRTEVEEWVAGTGLAPEKLRGLFELCRRFAEERLSPGLPLQSAHAVFRHFGPRLRETKQEHFLAVLLDTKRCYLGEVLVTMGTLDQSPVHPREVFNEAIRERASAVLIVHNHPSGDPAPSPDDLAVTRRLAEAGKVIGIHLLDHIIIGEERYVSLLEQGLL